MVAPREDHIVESWLVPGTTRSPFCSCPNLDLGSEIRRLRHAIGYSQQTLANIVGLEQRQIAVLELGAHDISVQTLRLIANALDTKLSDILGDIGC